VATLHFLSAGNTTRDRNWVRSIFERAGADHQLHCLPAGDDICRTRVRERNLSRPEGLFFGEVTDQQVDEVNRYFTPPGPEEGFFVVVHDAYASGLADRPEPNGS